MKHPKRKITEKILERIYVSTEDVKQIVTDITIPEAILSLLSFALDLSVEGLQSAKAERCITEKMANLRMSWVEDI